MFLLTWIRKLYKVLSADASPGAIAFAIAFGITLGCLPLTSGLAMLLIASVLVFRVQISSALLSFVVVKACALAGLSQLFIPVGGWLLENEALHGFWTAALNWPVIAWLDLDRLAVTGGAVVGAAVGAILFGPVVWLVVSYRRWLHDRVSENRFFRWLTNFWIVKGLRFIFVGR